MDSLDNNLIDRLRSMPKRGGSPFEMLRTITWYLSPAMVDSILLVRYFASAFSFRDGQAYPIHGWFPGGTGELKDPNIDRIMSKRIEQTRTEWDK